MGGIGIASQRDFSYLSLNKVSFLYPGDGYTVLRRLHQKGLYFPAGSERNVRMEEGSEK